MQSSDYATFVIMRAREAELNRIAERVRLAYERQDELRAPRAAMPGRPKNSASLSAAVAAVVARLRQKWSGPARQSARSREPGPARDAELEREKLRR